MSHTTITHIHCCSNSNSNSDHGLAKAVLATALSVVISKKSSLESQTTVPREGRCSVGRDVVYICGAVLGLDLVLYGASTSRGYAGFIHVVEEVEYVSFTHPEDNYDVEPRLP